MTLNGSSRKMLAFNGPKLRELRFRVGWKNQKMASRYIGVSAQAISRAECSYGLHQKTIDLILAGYQRRLAEMKVISPEALMTTPVEEDEEEQPVESL